jgi:hypothetical protein
VKIFAINDLYNILKVLNSLVSSSVSKLSMTKSIVILTLFILNFFYALSQSNEKEYMAPVDIPMLLSGNFGEFRSNHFHTGIDIKTQGTVGKKIYAVADGFISRINISPYGYGKALYIDHPNGQTSVYAHLKSFSDGIEDYILEKQYEEESFMMEHYPDSSLFYFKQGDVIGLSGNTGHSGGPHLHFEIRNTKTEHPVNPLQYGFDIKDQVDPIIKGIRLYPMDITSAVEGKNKEGGFTVKLASKGKYKLNKDTILVSGKIGLAIHTIDKMMTVNNTFSVYTLKVFSNEENIYSHQMDELDFETSRYLNCHMDYILFKKNKWNYHKCFPAENNKLEIYKNTGRSITFLPGDIKNIRAEASDIDGNVVVLSFVLKGSVAPSIASVTNSPLAFFDASSDNLYEDDEIRIELPKGTLYNDMPFTYNTGKLKDKSTKKYNIGSLDHPLQDIMQLYFHVDSKDSANANLKLYKVDGKGRFKVCQSEIKGRILSGRTKSFGSYVLKTDSKNPVIAVKTFPKYPSDKNGKIAFSLSDALSGVTSITAKVDGVWLKMAHNASHSYTYGNLKELGLSKGSHEFVLLVEDASNNSKEFRKTFNWQ